jgi:hypothetical protein
MDNRTTAGAPGGPKTCKVGRERLMPVVDSRFWPASTSRLSSIGKPNWFGRESLKILFSPELSRLPLPTATTGLQAAVSAGFAHSRGADKPSRRDSNEFRYYTCSSSRWSFVYRYSYGRPTTERLLVYHGEQQYLWDWPIDRGGRRTRSQHHRARDDLEIVHPNWCVRGPGGGQFPRAIGHLRIALLQFRGLPGLGL